MLSTYLSLPCRYITFTKSNVNVLVMILTGCDINAIACNNRIKGVFAD